MLLASAARVFMAGFNRMPSTALIFVKPAQPRTKPVLLPFPVERFCFGMFGNYHIFPVCRAILDECSPRQLAMANHQIKGLWPTGMGPARIRMPRVQHKQLTPFAQVQNCHPGQKTREAA